MELNWMESAGKWINIFWAKMIWCHTVGISPTPWPQMLICLLQNWGVGGIPNLSCSELGLLEGDSIYLVGNWGPGGRPNLLCSELGSRRETQFIVFGIGAQEGDPIYCVQNWGPGGRPNLSCSELGGKREIKFILVRISRKREILFILFKIGD